MRGDPLAARAREQASKMKVAIIEMVRSETEAGWFDLIAAEGDLQPLKGVQDPPKRDDLCLVLHTSGTTNKPKIVPLTHANIATGSLCIASTLQLKESDERNKPDDVNLNVMPLFHIHGISINVLASLLSGTSVVASPGFDPDTFFSWAYQCKASWYSAVPTMHLRVLQKAEEHYTNTNSYPQHELVLLRNCSAALLPSVGSRLQEALNLKVMPTYAMTESMPIASHPRYETCDLKSVGYAGGPNARVLLDDSTPCKPGEEGEVCVRGSCVTQGYEYRPHMKADPNIAAFHKLENGEAWLRTGDKGYVSGDTGTLTLVGRFKEIINRGGEKISPLEIEDALRQHEAIRDLVVFAVKHSQLGEVPGAAVVLRAAKSITLKELRAFGSRKFGPKWLPEMLVLMPEIPKGPTGKPARIGLAERLDLPELSDDNNSTNVMWEVVPDTPLPQDKGKIPAKAWEPSPEQEQAKAPSLSDNAMTDADLMHQIGEQLKSRFGESILALSDVKSAMRLHLLNVLRREVADRIGVDAVDVDVEAPVSYLGIESIRAVVLRETIESHLGCEVPLATFLSSSITDLAEQLSSKMSFGGAAASVVSDAEGVGEKEGGLPIEVLQPAREQSNSYPMRPLQVAYNVGRHLAKQGAWIYWETDIEGFDERRFNWAMNALLERHEALRTEMSAEGKQRVYGANEAHVSFSINVHRIPTGVVDRDTRIATQLQAVRHELQSFREPVGYPMFKIIGVDYGEAVNGKVRLAFLFDLLVADAAALNTLSTELSILYTASDQELALKSLPRVTCTHRQYVEGQEAKNAQPSEQAKKAKEKAYWDKKLGDVEDGGLPAAPELPKVITEDRQALSRSSATMSKELWNGFKNECLRRGLTPTNGLLAAYAAVLSTYSSKHFIMTMANFSRSVDAESIVGNLGDVMLVEVDFRQKSSFADAAKRLANEVYATLDHSKYTSGKERSYCSLPAVFCLLADAPSSLLSLPQACR